MLLLLVGKTASGKTTIQSELEKLGIKKITTYTTRPMRENESEGNPYYFLSDEEFKVMDSQGYFIETTSYEVATGDTWRYGTSIYDTQEDNACLIVNPDGLKFYSKLENLDICVIYLYSDTGTTWNRLRSRGDDNAEANRRIEADEYDFRDVLDYTDFAIRNNGQKSPEELAKIIKYLYEQKRNIYGSN